MSPGYHRFPTLHSDRLVFVSEDDLWAVPVAGGVARRLTANLGAISAPFFSPDGATLAFTGREEGHSEVYVMDSEGGPARRLTYLGAATTVIGWTPDGGRILFASDAGQPIERVPAVFVLHPEGGLPEPWPVGHAVSITFGTGGRTAIGRNNNDPARWKRYRGGTAGDIWVDPKGDGRFQRLVRLAGNLARPMWIGDRIYFLSDHEGYGNIYSCLPDGTDVRRHTDRTDYYVRFPNSDGPRIAYHAGGDLYMLDPVAGVRRRWRWSTAARGCTASGGSWTRRAIWSRPRSTRRGTRSPSPPAARALRSATGRAPSCPSAARAASATA